jgi:CheY-like chemotaxis protein
LAKILIIDDEDLVRFALRQVLEDVGYSVEEAEDGEKGLDRLANSNGVDLVITDIVMPNKEGVETIAEIKDAHPDLPVLAVSGGGRVGKVDYLGNSREAGASDTLRKPFTDAALLAKVAALLSG